MKRTVFFESALIVLLNYVCFAQNLVPNPSFEDMVGCPSGLGLIDSALGWRAVRNTPNYFNSCSEFDYSIPNNSFGFQYPSSEGCSAYAGLFTYPFSREYLGIRLDTSLTIGQKYFVSLKVVRANGRFSSTNNMGVLFTTHQSLQSTLDTIKNFAQINSTAIVTDTLNWKTIYGSFIADSMYSYIEIGNFYDDSNTVVITDSGNYINAYYFIDDICVSADSLFCAGYTFNCTTSIEENPKSNMIFYPNPTGGLLYFNSPGKSLVKVFDISGKLLMNAITIPSKKFINLSYFPNGMYLISITSNQKTFNSKVKIIH